jgi:SAM-dependent methyltransferase
VPGYGDDLAAIHASGFTDIAHAAARELLRRLPAHARVVDLGCGDGTTAEALVAAGHEVHGVDASPAFVALARRRVPGATFACASFVDCALPPAVDAIVAAGEVLGYALDPRVGVGTLAATLDRCAGALRPGGLLLFDLSGPGRRPGRTWTEGQGWTVLAETEVDGPVLVRRIVTFREEADGRHRRGEETHRLLLRSPQEVLTLLEDLGLAAQALPGGYDGMAFPPGLTAYLASGPRRPRSAARSGRSGRR